jgi:PTS system galactitol-specific IIA component
MAYPQGVTPSLFRRELCWAGLQAADAPEVLRKLARALESRGLVRPSFEEAVLRREAASPTGLPFPEHPVAIPHADPEHVLAPAIALCTLAAPVAFSEMGNPDGALAVQLVAMLALPDQQSCQRELVRLMERFQDQPFLARLCAAPDDGALFLLVSQEAAA